MIINFSNLGGGGSGSGSTVAWRQDVTAGTQIAQITINGASQDVYAPEGGNSDAEEVISTSLNDLNARKMDKANSQGYYEVDTDEEMNALNPKEGDICYVRENARLFDSEALYDQFYNGNNFIEGICNMPYQITTYDTLRFVAEDNPYLSGDPVQLWCEDYFENLFTRFNSYDIYESARIAIKNVVGGIAIYGDDYPEELWDTSKPFDFYVGGISASTEWAGGSMWYNYFESSANTGYAKVLKVYAVKTAQCYQFVNGSWERIVLPEDVVKLDNKVKTLENVLGGKLDFTNEVTLQDWSGLTNYQTQLITVYTNDGGQYVNEGMRLHTMGASTEYTNPKVTEIVTSDSFLRFKKMTQDEYDALVTKDPMVCYIIVEEE